MDENAHKATYFLCIRRIQGCNLKARGGWSSQTVIQSKTKDQTPITPLTGFDTCHVAAAGVQLRPLDSVWCRTQSCLLLKTASPTRTLYL